MCLTEFERVAGSDEFMEMGLTSTQIRGASE